MMKCKCRECNSTLAEFQYNGLCKACFDKKQNEVKCKTCGDNESLEGYPDPDCKDCSGTGTLPDCTDPQPIEIDQKEIEEMKEALHSRHPESTFEKTIDTYIAENAPQPTDEEMREAFEKKYTPINVHWDNEIEAYRVSSMQSNVMERQDDINKQYSRFRAGCKAQSAKLKEQADEIERLKDELLKSGEDNIALDTDRKTSSSLLSEAVEYIKNVEKITNNKCGCLDEDETFSTWCYAVTTLKELEQFTKGSKS